MEKENEEAHGLAELWTSISDLMSGLMLVFLLIAIAFMLEIQQSSKDQIDYKEKLEQILENYTVIEKELHDDLRKEFPKEYLAEWEITITQDNTFRFNSVDVKFRQGTNKISGGFKYLLADFFPKYIAVLSQEKYRDHIEEIRVEGHTSSAWYGNSKRVDYLKNLELSQDRARAVLTYAIGLSKIRNDFDWLVSVFRANGLSSAKLLDENGQLKSISKLPEDKELSRRVEFRIMTKSRKALEELEKLRQEMSKRDESK